MEKYLFFTDIDGSEMTVKADEIDCVIIDPSGREGIVIINGITRELYDTASFLTKLTSYWSTGGNIH